MALLSKGLTFVPTSKPPASALLADTEALRRKLNLRAYWNGVRTSQWEDSPYRGSLMSEVLGSQWTPPETITKDDAIWRKFITSITEKPHPKRMANLPRDWRETWKGLMENPAFFVTRADKGGRMVLWPREDYRREARRQLEDSKTYKEISEDTAKEMLAQLHFVRKNLAESLLVEGCVSRSEANRLAKKEWEIPPIYFLPKIHKCRNEESRTFAGRPVVAALNGPLQAIDKFLALLTAPLLKLIPGSLQDTRELLRALDNLPEIPEGATLFSADVVALYPSIPWEAGIRAACNLYGEHHHTLSEIATTAGKLPPPSPLLFQRMLSLVLTRNIFHFQNERWFHQIKGTAMGCSISVYLANAFMYEKTKYLITNPPRDLLYLGRYIDDLIGIWLGPPEDIPATFNKATDENIKLTFVIGPEELEALDVRISIADGRCSTRLFRKETDGHQFLHWQSDHPPSLKRSIPYSQLLRIKRNCTSQEDYKEEEHRLLKRFEARKYPVEVLNSAREKAELKDRKDLLLNSIKLPEDKVITFTTTYHFGMGRSPREAVQTLIEDLTQSTHNSLLQLDNHRTRVAFRTNPALASTTGKPFKQGSKVNDINHRGVYATMLRERGWSTNPISTSGAEPAQNS